MFWSEEDIRPHLRYKELIPAIRQALMDYSAGRVEQPLRQILRVVPESGDAGAPPGWFAVMPAIHGPWLGVKTVTGFTGSSVWHSLYAFPPTSQAYWEAGFADFAARWTPILDGFERAGVDFALEAHPTEIAFDLASAERAVAAVNGHKRFCFNFDPSHFAYQGVDYVGFLRRFGARIRHVHMKDVWWGKGDGSVGVFGGHTSFGDPRRYWDFRSLGRGMVDFEAIIVALNDIGYAGPLSVEWEDGRMDRIHGATESAAFCRRLDFKPAATAFDAAFGR